MVEYAKSLRSIGQALETLRVEDFDLEVDGEAFLVRCSVPWPKEVVTEQPDQARLLRHIWGVLPPDSTLELKMSITSRFKATDVDLRYSLKDVDRLDEEGKAKRGDSPVEPHAPTLSQFLRTIGAYVNQKPARLLKISRSNDSIAIQYESPSGQKNDESLSVGDLYDLWVWMSMKRADRNRS
jgi:hypothetical protein